MKPVSGRLPRRLIGLAACALGLLAVTPTTAVPVRETPAEIFQHRGMPMALATIILGAVALWAVPSRAGREREVVPPRELRRRWAAVAAWIGAIYLTLPVGFEVVSAIVNAMGTAAFRRGVNGLGTLAGLACVVVLLRRRIPLRGYLVFAGLALAYAYYFRVLEVTVKRVHFLEYSFLSVLGERALRPVSPPPRLYLWGVLLSLAAGGAEETIAVFLPRRYGAVSDVLFDVAGGTMGMLFVRFVLHAR